MGAATCDTRGSPFQLPTRLADGLGPGSDLETSYLASFAPSSHPVRILGPPHRPAGRQADLGCNCFSQTIELHVFANLSNGVEKQEQFIREPGIKEARKITRKDCFR